MSQELTGLLGQKTRSFTGLLTHFPHVWDGDLGIMLRYLAPQPGETILEIGGGGGYFSAVIADRIGPSGRLIVADPAPGQLRNMREANYPNVTLLEKSADQLELGDTQIDAIWSRGAFHHVIDKTRAFRLFRKHIKPNGRVLLFDTFAGSKASEYFDDHVAKASRVGHEAAHLSKEFTDSLCHIAGFRKPEFHDLVCQWRFESRAAIGKFLKMLHETTAEYTEEDSIVAAEKYMGTHHSDGSWFLNWPMTLVSTSPKSGGTT